MGVRTPLLAESGSPCTSWAERAAGYSVQVRGTFPDLAGFVRDCFFGRRELLEIGKAGNSSSLVLRWNWQILPSLPTAECCLHAAISHPLAPAATLCLLDLSHLQRCSAAMSFLRELTDCDSCIYQNGECRWRSFSGRLGDPATHWPVPPWG
jgi:hypothetical protein